MKSTITRTNKFILSLLLTFTSINNIYVVDNYNIIINIVLFLTGVHVVLNVNYIYEFYKLNNIIKALSNNKDVSNTLEETVKELIITNINDRSFISLLGSYSNILLIFIFVLSPSNLIISVVLILYIITLINFIQENIYINNKYKTKN